MQTERLYLRERTKQLVDAILHESIEQQLEFFGSDSIKALNVEINKSKKRFENRRNASIKWDVILKDTKKVVGNCGFHNWLAEHERAEMAYFLHEADRGKGLMGEAINCILKYGFDEMKLNRIEAFIGPHNSPSKSVVLSCGFKLEGCLREHFKFQDEIYDSEVYGLLKSEYNL